MTETGPNDTNQETAALLKIHCPHCWTLLDWGTVQCPTCGHQISLPHYDPPLSTIRLGGQKLREYTPPMTVSSSKSQNGLQRLKGRFSIKNLVDFYHANQYVSYEIAISILVIILFFCPLFRIEDQQSISAFNASFRLGTFMDIFPRSEAWLPVRGLSVLVFFFLVPLLAIGTIIGSVVRKKTELCKFVIGFILCYFLLFLMVRYSSEFFNGMTWWAIVVFLVSLALMVPPSRRYYLNYLTLRQMQTESGTPNLDRRKRILYAIPLILLFLIPFFLPHGSAPSGVMKSEILTDTSVEGEEARVTGPGIEMPASEMPAVNPEAPDPLVGNEIEPISRPNRGRTEHKTEENALTEQDVGSDGLARGVDENETKSEDSDQTEYRGADSVSFTLDNIKATIGQIRKAVPQFKPNTETFENEVLQVDVVLENVTPRSILVLRNIWDNVQLVDSTGHTYEEYARFSPQLSKAIRGKLQSMTLNARSVMKDIMVFPLPENLSDTLTIQGDPGYYHSTDNGIVEISHQPFSFRFKADDIQ
ncbi:hypothetical protein JXQ70_02355 [bacterium]|nr:hypothetical protein [bacterium]